MTPAEELQDAVDQLQTAYDTAASEVSLQARTPDGRYVLLDALTALVNGRAALVTAETASRQAGPRQPDPEEYCFDTIEHGPHPWGSLDNGMRRCPGKGREHRK